MGVRCKQPKARRALPEIWAAGTKADADAAFDNFFERRAPETMRRDTSFLAPFPEPTRYPIEMLARTRRRFDGSSACRYQVAS
jgi:hypothetical protein